MKIFFLFLVWEAFDRLFLFWMVYLYDHHNIIKFETVSFLFILISSQKYGIDHRTTLGRRHRRAEISNSEFITGSCGHGWWIPTQVVHESLRNFYSISESDTVERSFSINITTFRLCLSCLPAGWESWPAVLSFFALLSIHFPVHRYTQLWKTFFLFIPKQLFPSRKTKMHFTMRCGLVSDELNRLVAVLKSSFCGDGLYTDRKSLCSIYGPTFNFDMQPVTYGSCNGFQRDEMRVNIEFLKWFSLFFFGKWVVLLQDQTIIHQWNC